MHVPLRIPGMIYWQLGLTIPPMYFTDSILSNNDKKEERQVKSVLPRFDRLSSQSSIDVSVITPSDLK